jgi:methyl-accepting chemotaxis protein
MAITKRLLLTLALALFAMLLVGAYGVYALNQAQERFRYVQINTFPSLKVMDSAQRVVTEVRVQTLRHLMVANPEEKSQAESKIAASDKRFDALMAEYLAEDISSDADRRLLEVDKEIMARYRQNRDRILALSRSNRTAEALSLMASEPKPGAAVELMEAIENHARFNYALAGKLSDENNQAYSRAIALSVAIMLLALLVSAVLAFRLFYSIRQGLSGIQDSLEQVSSSLDFTLRAPADSKDEIGMTARAFNHLLENLQQTFRLLGNGAREVELASQQLSRTASEVSASATSQSEVSASMAATIEQMTVSINHVAEQSRQQSEGAVAAGALVEESTRIIDQTIRDIHEISQVVKNSASSIHELEARSGEVASVVGVIRDIADQTNLLALNAAIEAARAGEQGRGFAVVADEVRKLAERTTKSTQEVSVTIDAMLSNAQNSTTQMNSAEDLVAAGVARGDGAASAIRRIGDYAGAAVRGSDEVAAAIKQQGVASNNIAAQVEHTAQASEEASASALHAAQSAARLDQLARTQAEILARYRV